jgi:2-haloacid dehalogenase
MTDKSGPFATRRQLLVGAALTVTVASWKIAPGSAVAQTVSTEGKIKAVAFDLLTIFNPFSVDDVIERNFPGKGKQLASAWRTRIFDYCWLRTLNQTYVDFWQVMDDALSFTFEAAKTDLAPAARAQIMEAFVQIKPWPDSVAALNVMRKAGLRLAPVSTFTEEMLITTCSNAGIADLFDYYLTTDRVKAYKPDPRAYKMAEDAFKLRRGEIVFAAFGGWDAAGAKSFGLNTFWVNRTGAPMERLGVTPDGVGSSLTELAEYVRT